MLDKARILSPSECQHVSDEEEEEIEESDQISEPLIGKEGISS